MKKISVSKVLVASPNHYNKLVERYPKMEQIWGLVIEVVGKLLKEKSFVSSLALYSILKNALTVFVRRQKGKFY